MNIEQRVDRAIQKLNGQYDRKVVEDISKALTEVDKEALINDEPVKIMGFGTLKTAVRKTRKGTKPGTKDYIQIPERTTVRFVPSSDLKALLNK